MAAPPRGSDLRFPAFLWALFHAPLFLLLFAGSLGPALRGVPGAFGPALWPAIAAEALVLSLLIFLVPLPLSFLPRAYRLAAPLAAGLGTVLAALDARLYSSLGFHVNGFFFKVLSQPAALKETGVPTSEVMAAAAQAVAWIAAEALAGAWFLGRFARPRRVWPALSALVLLGVAERTYVASLTFFGGQSVYAAGQVMPLQAPVRMNAFWGRLTGRPAPGNPLKAVARETAMKLPPGVDPAALTLTRRPDVLLLVLESTRHDYLSPEVMPRMWQRVAREGTLFERHYTSAPTTFFAVYSLLFGLDAHTLDAAVGSGRRPLLFGALSAHGYSSRVLAASSVDWMGMRENVFGDVQQQLETDWPRDWSGDRRDEAIVEAARAHARATPRDRPIFLFLFFFGTHFNYFPTPRSERFLPQWDGSGVLKETPAPPALILARGRNAAVELDLKIDDLLGWWERERGRPLVIFTGDHGEEMKEKGHLGHGSSLVREQIEVPMAILGPGVPVGRHSGTTSHVDVLATLFRLLGDSTPPARYGDGQDMFAAPEDRFVLVNMGWEPRYAAVSRDLKVVFHGMDAGLGGVLVTDPDDRPIAGASDRFAGAVPRILQLFRQPAGRVAEAR